MKLKLVESREVIKSFDVLASLIGLSFGNVIGECFYITNVENGN